VNFFSSQILLLFIEILKPKISEKQKKKKEKKEEEGIFGV
jgi:hypothetical protein